MFSRMLSLVANMSRQFRFAVVLATSIGVACGSVRAQEPKLDYFRIGTGSPAGTYFPVGELLGGIISLPPGAAKCEPGGHCGVPGLIAVAQDSPGSVANVADVAGGRYDSALVQADVVHAAFYGENLFATHGGFPDLRVIANLYTETMHLVARKGANIASVGDLKGKRVSVDTPQSGTHRNAFLILEAFGIERTQISLSEVNFEQASDQLLAGKLDAFFLMTGFPASGISALMASDTVVIVPIKGKVADTLRREHPYFLTSAIPANTYANLDEVTSLGVGAQWVVRGDQSEQRVHDIARALWHPTARETLDAGHPRAHEISVETALHGVSIPLHAGALRFYLEAGILE
ncbi:MAG TPA: TAXI family TRAP transporter solute-binding subunit [Sneathiellales bacterium]|nr:TAXI family TRAP transporter solute-binding subunit [Sneathiellales bacterium]